MTLPASLSEAIAIASEGRPEALLGRTVAAMSDAYRRSGRPAGGSFDPNAALAYALYRLPATYAAIAAAFAQTSDARPAPTPASLLDLGSGPGTALWAARAVWPSLREAVAVERDAAMRGLGERLMRHANAQDVPNTRWLGNDLRALSVHTRADLVVLAYVLGELPEAERPPVVAALWRAASDLLVLVEPGTPAGFERIRVARDALRALGAYVVAPCPHDGACPLQGDDWCHFSARLERAPAHRRLKGGTLGYEDEKFAFVAVARTAPLTRRSRVLRHPEVRPGHVVLTLCTGEGIRHRTVAKSAGDRYRVARSLRWGASLPADGALPADGSGAPPRSPV